MKNSWVNNPKAKDKAKQLLHKAGLPLEFEVSQICHTFTSQHGDRTDFSISTQRLVYGGYQENEPALREIDQCLSIYQEFEVSRQLGLQFIVQVLIECKHREDLEIFGFPDQEIVSNAATFPAITDLSPALLLKQSLRHEPQFLVDKPLSTLSALTIRAGKQPTSVFKEDLVYKAGASLYDFIKFESDELNISANRTVDKLGLLRDFQDYIQTKQYSWALVARKWIEGQSIDVYRKFNELYYGGRLVYDSISINFPIVCVNSPLYSVSITKTGKIKDFKNSPFLFTGMRLPDWPGRFRYLLVHRRPEALVIVTNPRHLPMLLEQILSWSGSIVQALVEADMDLKERALLEAYFLRSVISLFHKDDQKTTRYRSDVDIDLL